MVFSRVVDLDLWIILGVFYYKWREVIFLVCIVEYWVKILY